MNLCIQAEAKYLEANMTAKAAEARDVEMLLVAPEPGTGRIQSLIDRETDILLYRFQIDKQIYRRIQRGIGRQMDENKDRQMKRHTQILDS